MKRRFPGLHRMVESDSVPDGVYLVRVNQVRYCWHSQKPFYALTFQVLEPKASAQRFFSTQLYCTPKALWRLSWFLRDFGYDRELLERDELEEKSLIGLTGVVQVSHLVQDGTSLLNLESFAAATQWNESRIILSTSSSDSGVAS